MKAHTVFFHGAPNVNRERAIFILLTIGALLGTTATLEAQISGRILRVGLFAGATPIVRSGHCSFVEVELRNANAEPFDGQLRVDQLDRDGDVVTSLLDAPLTPDGQWHPYQIYFTPHNVDQEVIRVRLYDADGRLATILSDTGESLTELVSDMVYDISQDHEAAGHQLIVDLTSPRKLPHISWLNSQRRNAEETVNRRVVRGLSPRDLPFRWQGLEGVDAIAWDDADPSTLSQQQVDALIDWVRHGGRLLITTGQNWQALAKSPLAEYLPATIKGMESRREIPEFIDIISVNKATWGERLRREYEKTPITCCKLSAKLGSLPIPPKCDSPQIAYRRMLGRGVITFIGAPLQKLLPPSLAGMAEIRDGTDDSSFTIKDNPFITELCEALVATEFLRLAKPRKRLVSAFGGYNPRDLFGLVRRSVGFEAAAAGFLVFGILFAILYTLTATVGCYWYLKHRGWQHQAWTAFALVSLAGSVLGTSMVWVLRGFTNKLHQTTIVDGQAGTDYAYATTLFGLKTPDHTSLDLALPVGTAMAGMPRDSGLLRAMPEETSWDWDQTGTQYLAPEDYDSVLAGTRLNRIPIRATLKEFMGLWHGPMNGLLEGRLVTRRTGDPAVPYEFGQGSFIRNALGVNLRNCYLLETQRDITGQAFRVIVHELGNIPDITQTPQLTADEINKRLYYKDRTDPTKRITKLNRLNTQITEWCRTLERRLPQLGANKGTEQANRLAGSETDTALLLLSVFDLIDTNTEEQKGFKRSFGRSLSCTHQLSSNTAILIGFSDDEPPPSILEVDRANLRPNQARTMYRFLIPVERSEGSVSTS